MATTVGFCRELAIAEPLAGTGNDAIQRWILVEDCGPWGAKVPRDTELPAATREWLLARDAEPHTRVQLIRRPRTRTGSLAKVFVASTPADPSARRLVELEVPLEHIPNLDPDALLAQAPAHDPDDLAALYLVCTHGTRDRCCAKWGMSMFEALRAHAGERVWQCSHLGGHRFAPTFLTLPSGLLWGRVELADLDELRAGLAAGRLSRLSKLRGRCCHPRVVQAAECLLRERESLLEDAALTFVEVQTLADQVEQVWFEHRSGQGRERVGVTIETALGVATPGSCGDPLEQRRHFQLCAITRPGPITPR
ncbi:sucrase ferredoxin [Enhygromyxa salina]|nr:sucrase ferredoxin [Enhygromyxa salina]